MSKKARDRDLADNEAKAVTRNIRVSPQKLNLVAALIRGKAVATALADLEFSRKRIAKDVRKRGEQSRPRRRRSGRGCRPCRQGSGHEALSAARARARRAHS